MNLIGVYISTALRQLVKNKGRSLLTMLGIIIGIGSVIFILTTGEIAKRFLLAEISQFGTNIVEVVTPSSFGVFGDSDSNALTEEDVELVENSPLLPEVEAISAGMTTIETFEYESTSVTVSVFGDRPAVFTANNLEPIKGRLFNVADMQNSGRVVVIGEQLAEDVFGSTSAALNEQIKLGGTFFTIIGVTEDLSFGGAGFGPQLVYAPLSTVRRLFLDPSEQKEVSFLLIEFTPGIDVQSFEQRLSYVLRDANDALDDPDAYLIVSREAALETFDTILIALQAFISAVAGISLVVGGIGIMNIMLVTVKERTKEIGLRKAIGARNSSILVQFLVESVVLTTVGGLIGVLVGLGLTLGGVTLIAVFQPAWGVQFVFVPSALLISTAVSAGVGIVFGLYPAIKASKLPPIEALRYE